MALLSRSLKFQKQHSRNDDIQTKHKKDSFFLGCFGLFSTESGKVTDKQIAAIRLVLRRLLKKQARIWINLKTESSLTKKPQETRLGKGKGSVKQWFSAVRPGQILIEIKGYNSVQCIRALKKASKKLSINVNIQSRYTRWVL